MTLGLCEGAPQTADVWLSLNFVDANDNPIGVGTPASTLRYETYDIASIATTTPFPTCGSGGEYVELDFAYKVLAGTKYALWVGALSASGGGQNAEYQWIVTDPEAAPTSTPSTTPSGYFVTYRWSDGVWQDPTNTGRAVNNAVRLQFTCIA